MKRLVLAVLVVTLVVGAALYHNSTVTALRGENGYLVEKNRNLEDAHTKPSWENIQSKYVHAFMPWMRTYGDHWVPNLNDDWVMLRAVEHVRETFQPTPEEYSLRIPSQESEMASYVLNRERSVVLTKAISFTSMVKHLGRVGNDYGWQVPESKAAIREIMGPIPDSLPRERWAAFWFGIVTTLKLTEDHDGAVHPLTQRELLILNYGDQFLPGIENPTTCIGKAREYFLKQVQQNGKLDELDAWRARVYREALRAHANTIEFREGQRAYELYRAETFPYDFDLSTNDLQYAKSCFHGLKHVEEFSEGERVTFVRVWNKRMQPVRTNPYFSNQFELGPFALSQLPEEEN